jgi:hypothetical protein
MSFTDLFVAVFTVIGLVRAEWLSTFSIIPAYCFNVDFCGVDCTFAENSLEINLSGSERSVSSGVYTGLALGCLWIVSVEFACLWTLIVSKPEALFLF